MHVEEESNSTNTSHFSLPLHSKWGTRTVVARMIHPMVATTMDEEADRRNAASSATAVVASTWNRTAILASETIAQRGRTTRINARATAMEVEHPTSSATIATAEVLIRTEWQR